MEKLLNRRQDSLEVSVRSRMAKCIQKMEYDASIKIENLSQSKSNESSAGNERKSFHSFHPTSPILQAIALPDVQNTFRANKNRIQKKYKDSKLDAILKLNTVDDYLSAVEPISEMYKKYVKREKVLKGMRAIAVPVTYSVDMDFSYGTALTVGESETHISEDVDRSSVSNQSDAPSAWLWGPLRDGHSSFSKHSPFDRNHNTLSHDDGKEDKDESILFWGSLKGSSNYEVTRSDCEFSSEEIADTVKLIENEKLRDSYFQLFGTYLEDDFELSPPSIPLDKDGIENGDVGLYAREARLQLAQDAISIAETRNTLQELVGETESIESSFSINRTNENYLTNVKRIYNQSIKSMKEATAHIDVDLRIIPGNERTYFTFLKQIIQYAQSVLETASNVDTCIQSQYKNFKQNCAQRRTRAALAVAEVIMTSSQLEATYQEKYAAASLVFKQREDSSLKLKLSTESRIVSSKQMDVIREKAEVAMARQGLLVKEFQAEESKLLLNIK